MGTSPPYLGSLQRVIQFNFIQTFCVYLDAIYFNSNTCNVWLLHRHLEKVSIGKARLATRKQSPAKQTLNKDVDVCVCSCVAVVVTFNGFELFTRISILNTFEILNDRQHSKLFEFFCKSNCICIQNSEFKQTFISCCFERQAVVSKEDIKRRNPNMAPSSTLATQLRTLRTDPGHLQLLFEQEAMDTKL